MKKYIAIALVLLITVCANAQKIGEWRIYKSYHNATKCVAGNGVIYALCNGSIFSYNTSDSEVITFDKSNYLTDDNIADIAYCAEQKALVVIYSNANIDLLYDDNEVYNISDFRLKDVSDKTINSVSVIGSTAYLSTNNGLLLLDVERREFSSNYNFGQKVLSSTIIDNHIYTSTGDGVYAGNTANNLLDKNNWQKIMPASPKQIINYKNQLLYMFGDAIYNASLSKAYVSDPSNSLNYACECNGSLWVLGTQHQFLINEALEACEIRFPTNYVAYANNLYWSAEGYNGLIAYEYSAEKGLNIKVNSIIPDSPITNKVYKMSVTPDGVCFVSGKHHFDGIYYDNDGYAAKYIKDADRWLNFDYGKTVSDVTGYPFVNPTSIAQDPKDGNHHYITATGYGLYEFRDGKIVKLHKAADEDNTIHTLYGNPYYTWLNSAIYDRNGNLLFTNTITDIKNNNFDCPLKILTADGTWKQIELNDICKEQYCNNIILQSNGLLWGTLHWGSNGFFCVDTNNTIDDSSDDKSLNTKELTNQDGIHIQTETINCIAEDMKGQIWIGTNVGPLVIKNPTKYIQNGNSTTALTQVKIPRNDGTNYADYLLDNIRINTIAVDGANRKWFGTENGVFLFSADCLTQIEHFTTENSPLIANSISDIKVAQDGTIFIATDKGMVSYKSEASEASESLDAVNIYAYPNPVKPDYDGYITIKGLTFDSKVRIVNTAGQLMTEGTSTGGQFVWNGKNGNGSKVASGVYFVLIGDSELKNGAATKILVLK